MKLRPAWNYRSSCPQKLNTRTRTHTRRCFCIYKHVKIPIMSTMKEAGVENSGDGMAPWETWQTLLSNPDRRAPQRTHTLTVVSALSTNASGSCELCVLHSLVLGIKLRTFHIPNIASVIELYLLVPSLCTFDIPTCRAIWLFAIKLVIPVPNLQMSASV